MTLSFSKSSVSSKKSNVQRREMLHERKPAPKFKVIDKRRSDGTTVPPVERCEIADNEIDFIENCESYLSDYSEVIRDITVESLDINIVDSPQRDAKYYCFYFR